MYCQQGSDFCRLFSFISLKLEFSVVFHSHVQHPHTLTYLIIFKGDADVILDLLSLSKKSWWVVLFDYTSCIICILGWVKPSEHPIETGWIEKNKWNCQLSIANIPWKNGALFFLSIGSFCQRRIWLYDYLCEFTSWSKIFVLAGFAWVSLLTDLPFVFGHSNINMIEYKESYSLDIFFLLEQNIATAGYLATGDGSSYYNHHHLKHFAKKHDK